MCIPEGVLTLTWFTYACLFFQELDVFCANYHKSTNLSKIGCFFFFWYSELAIGDFHHRRRCPIFIKLDVFCANYHKSTNLSKIGCFLHKIGIQKWVVNEERKRFSESRNFDVWHAHPHIQHFSKNPPPRDMHTQRHQI